MEIRKAAISDCLQIACLHREGIGAGFLRSLGAPFLSLLYEALIRWPQAVVLTAAEGQKILGFVAGVKANGRFMRFFALRYGARAVWRIFPRLFRLDAFRKIIEVFFCSSQKGLVVFPQAELLSIAVREDARGRGIGKDLFLGLTAWFQRQGVKNFKIIVGKDLLSAKRFYNTMGCRLAGEVEIHKPEKSDVFIYEL